MRAGRKANGRRMIRSLRGGEHAIADQAFALTADDSEHFTDDLDLLLLH
jgi:hypothetical protein